MQYNKKNFEKHEIGTDNETTGTYRLLCASGKVIDKNEQPHSTAYSMEAMTRSKVFKWCKKFCDGQTTIGSRHPQTVRTEIMITLIWSV